MQKKNLHDGDDLVGTSVKIRIQTTSHRCCTGDFFRPKLAELGKGHLKNATTNDDDGNQTQAKPNDATQCVHTRF